MLRKTGEDYFALFLDFFTLIWSELSMPHIKGEENMFYQAELSFLQSCLARCQVQTLLVLPQALLIEPLDLGIRKLVGAPAGICSTCAEVVENIKDHTVYFLSDAYACSYLFFRLPRTEQLLLVGPYINVEKTAEQIMEAAEMR